VRVSTNVCRGVQKVWDIKLECVCVCVFVAGGSKVSGGSTCVIK